MEPYALEGTYSCLDYFHTVDDPFSNKLLADYNAMWDDKFLFTAGAAATGMYRAIKLYEQGVIKTNGDLKRELSLRPLTTYQWQMDQEWL